MAQKMTGAEMVLKALADQGVEHIFGYPGGVGPGGAISAAVLPFLYMISVPSAGIGSRRACLVASFLFRRRQSEGKD